MWTRRNLKENAKVAFKRNYWKCVLVALIIGMITGGGGSSAGSAAGSTTQDIVSDNSFPDENYNEFYTEDFFDESLEGYNNSLLPPAVTGIVATVGIAVLLVILVLAAAVSILLFGPLEVGCCNFFKKNAYENAELNTLTIAFKKKHYWKMVGTIFLRTLYTVLWTFVFIVPGIIKSYEYRMIPYILSDSPDISRQDAFHFSKEMMRGHKWNTFILDLSFFGWALIGVITCGIAGVFYVQPYIAATNAELFIAIREEYFRENRE